MYVLIMTLVLWNSGYKAGMGGASVETLKLDSLEQCQAVGDAFLNDMKMTNKEITGTTNRSAKITRKASCIKISDDA